MNVLTMAVQLAKRWGPPFCPQCQPRAKKLLELAAAAYKILSARREQMLTDKTRTSARQRVAQPGAQDGRGADLTSLRVLEILEDIRDGLVSLQNNGQH